MAGADKINSGTNITVTGTGSTVDPYVINATGGGGGEAEADALVTRTSAFSLPHLTETPIQWDTEQLDNGGYWVIGSPTRFTIPVGGDGTYLIGYGVGTDDASASQQRWISAVRKNGTTTVPGTSVEQIFTTNNFPSTSGSALIEAVAGDFFETIVIQTSGTAKDLFVTKAAFWITKIAGTGGGGGIDTVTARRTSGNLALSSTTWANVDTGIDLVIAAVAGDKLEVSVSAAKRPGGSGNGFIMDVATIVAGSPVNYLATSGSVGDFGVGAWYIENVHVQDQGAAGGPRPYTVQAGDISGGNVTLRLRYRVSSGSVTLYASTTLPLDFWVKNLGSGGGSGGTTGVVDFAARSYTGGDFNLSSATWADVNNTAFDMVLDAQAGDYVEYSLSARNTTSSQATDAAFDVVAVASGTSLTGTGGAAGRGIISFYMSVSFSSAAGGATILPVALVPGDISAGQVTVRLRYRQAAAGTKGISANTDMPFLVSAKTLRPPP